MFGATSYGLNRGPDVTFGRQKIPSRIQELFGLDSATVIHGLRFAFCAVGKHLGPDHIAVALDSSVASAELEPFDGIQRGVNAAENNPRSAG